MEVKSLCLRSWIKFVINIIDEKKLDIDIEIDGGVNSNAGKKAKEFGANILVSGTTVF